MSQTTNTTIARLFPKSVRHNEQVFISGQIGIDPSSGKLQNESFELEAHQVMQNLRAILRAEGLGYNELVNVTVYLKDMGRYDAFNNVYQGYFTKHYPARVCIAVKDLPSGANIEISAIAKTVSSPKEIVRLFLEEVRSGAYPEKAAVYMADTVLAHQVTSENPTTVKRTPANYTAHVKEFVTLFGKFDFSITELLADGDKVYAKWVQKGTHQRDIDQHKATGLPLIEFTSAVYRIENEKIAEYWLQSDRFGMEEQLKKNTLLASRIQTEKN